MSQQPTADDHAAILGRSVVLQGLSAGDLEPVVAASQVITRKPGEAILQEGTVGDGLYIILEGEVDVFLPQRAASGATRPTRIRLNKIGPGRCLGEYGVIDDQPSSASASALTASRLSFLPKAEFRKLVVHHDRIGRIVYANLLRYLVGQLRGKDKELDIIVLSGG